ncbi:MAG: hypothetical protein EBX52_06985 [Proteobacteria bacterium]|nr:hypothetical protein [Pseudomonadota bacterium]
MGSYFKLHVIPPPRPLGWESPRSLLLDTLWHHLLQDQAPIGHFYIEFGASSPWKNGVSRVLTGMSRKNANASTLKVMLEQVGLGTFFYDFPGKLDHGVKALRELEKAAKRNRLKTIRVDLETDRAHLLFDELNEWIRHGSHQHYGGGHRILRGEGSGCAEMGAHFLNLALGLQATPKEWIRAVHAPLSLVGGARTGRKVGLGRVFLEGTAWARDEKGGILYATPDMELAWEWLERFAPARSEVPLSPAQVSWSAEPVRRIEFSDLYPQTGPVELARVWDEIRIDREHLDGTAEAVVVGVVVVVDQLQMPDAITAGHTTAQRTKPAQTTVIEAVEGELGEEALHGCLLGLEQITIVLIPVERRSSSELALRDGDGDLITGSLVKGADLPFGGDHDLFPAQETGSKLTAAFGRCIRSRYSHGDMRV